MTATQDLQDPRACHVLSAVCLHIGSGSHADPFWLSPIDNSGGKIRNAQRINARYLTGVICSCQQTAKALNSLSAQPAVVVGLAGYLLAKH